MMLVTEKKNPRQDRYRRIKVILDRKHFLCLHLQKIHLYDLYDRGNKENNDNISNNSNNNDNDNNNNNNNNNNLVDNNMII